MGDFVSAGVGAYLVAGADAHARPCSPRTAVARGRDAHEDPFLTLQTDAETTQMNVYRVNLACV